MRALQSLYHFILFCIGPSRCLFFFSVVGFWWDALEEEIHHGKCHKLHVIHKLSWYDYDDIFTYKTLLVKLFSGADMFDYNKSKVRAERLERQVNINTNSVLTSCVLLKLNFVVNLNRWNPDIRCYHVLILNVFWQNTCVFFIVWVRPASFQIPQKLSYPAVKINLYLSNERRLASQLFSKLLKSFCIIHLKNQKAEYNLIFKLKVKWVLSLNLFNIIFES